MGRGHRQQESRNLVTSSFPGHMRILQFRKKDGSYGAWLHRDSSTWLTAFVLKILSLAQKQVADSPEKLQETAGWLLSQQLGDGSFHDPCPVIHRDMQV